MARIPYGLINRKNNDNILDGQEQQKKEHKMQLNFSAYTL